ncbi:MAG: CIA30 family protein [Deltaproteobacteria bacterium]|nr:CIA30 family protein [Deltaproteobacteria bacterium]
MLANNRVRTFWLWLVAANLILACGQARNSDHDGAGGEAGNDQAAGGGVDEGGTSGSGNSGEEPSASMDALPAGTGGMSSPPDGSSKGGSGGTLGQGGSGGTTGASLPAGFTGKQWQWPATTDRKRYEDFDQNGDKLPIVPWPQQGGWIASPYGLPVQATLDSSIKGAGKFSLRMEYRIDSGGQAGFGHLYTPGLNWSGYDAIQFWLDPDGSRSFFDVNLLNQGGDKAFYQARFVMSVDEPVVVTMPFKAFADLTHAQGSKRAVDQSHIDEVTFWIRGYKPDPNKAWTIRLDTLDLVKLAEPLDHVVAWPVSALPKAL